MSYDLHVYSQSDEPVSMRELEKTLGAQGWTVAFMKEWFRPIRTARGPLPDEGFIVGWTADSEDSAQIRETIMSGDKDAFDVLYKQHRVGACEVYLTLPLDADEFEERFAGASVEQTAFLRAARTNYYLRTSAGRSPLSTQLQEAVWHAIGETTEGLMEDPQSGEYAYSQDMPPSRPIEVTDLIFPRSPKWTIVWYSVFALIGTVLLASSFQHVEMRGLMAAIGILHAPVAYGLYRGYRPARWAAILLTSALLLVGLTGMFMTSFALRKLIVATIYARILMELFSPQVKAYFD